MDLAAEQRRKLNHYAQRRRRPRARADIAVPVRTGISDDSAQARALLTLYHMSHGRGGGGAMIILGPEKMGDEQEE
jgi:hypothetical protein